MTVHVDLPGAGSFPTFTKLCLDCGLEFEIHGTYEDSDKAVCPACQSVKIKELYMSFPTDGPGFQKDYASQSDRLRGGSCKESD